MPTNKKYFFMAAAILIISDVLFGLLSNPLCTTKLYAILFFRL